MRRRTIQIFAIATVAVSAGVSTPGASAQSEARVREYRDDSRWQRRSDVSRDLQRLNYQLERLRDELRTSGARGWSWSRYRELMRSRDRVEWQIRHGEINPHWARNEVDRIRTDARELQERLRIHERA